MTQLQIIENNIDVYLNARSYLISNSTRYKNTDLLKILSCIEYYEGWGRCRKIIDPNSDEYKLAYDHLNVLHDEATTNNLIRDIQSATLTSFYTPEDVAQYIMQYAIGAYKELNGKEAMTLLEPSAGTGNFLSNLDDMKRFTQIETCEKDTLSRTILQARLKAIQQFVGSENMHYSAQLDRFEKAENCSYDLIVSNIPFGDVAVLDKSFGKHGGVYRSCQKHIHNYYFLKSMHLLNDGGILAFITSRGFLSSEKNKPYREEMLKHGRIINILRLPDNMFETIEVGTDLIVYQKTSQKGNDVLDEVFFNGWAEDEQDVSYNSHIDVTLKKNQYGKQVYYYKYVGIDLHVDIKKYLFLQLKVFMENHTPPSNPTPTKPKRPAKATNSTTSAKVTEASVTTVPEASRSGYTAEGIFSLLAGADDHERVLTTCASIMQRIYSELTDDNRKLFHDCYTSLLSVMSYNMGKQHTLHSMMKRMEYYNYHPDFASFLSTLEQKDDEGKWVAADIFFKDTHKAEWSGNMSAEQALAASLNKYGKVDMPFMQVTSKLTRQELIESLDKQMYLNPITGIYEESDRWLTGNVVEKAREARNHLDHYKNGERQDAERAITALEAARPVQITFDDIDSQFGARWIPCKYYEDFVYHISGTTREEDRYNMVQIYLSPANDEFVCNLYVHKREWNVGSHGASDVIEWALRGAVPNFKRKGDNDKQEDDEEMRQRALQMVEKVKQAWVDFINLPTSKYIREDVERIYNERFNCEVRPKYDGSFQTFPDLHLENLGIKELYQSQKDAIWMLKRNNGGVCWHEVGTGKTLIMCITAYEMKRIGMVNKPIIIGLKANISQIIDTFRKAYPNAKLLAPKAKDFSESGRKDLFNQIKNNDWDCIIMTHDQFQQIPTAESTNMRLMKERIDALNDVLNECHDKRFYGRALRGLQTRKDKLEMKLTELQHEIAQRTDKVMDFSDMCIDHIFVDESHYFKNLGFETRHERVAGIGNTEGSKKAFRLLTAIRDIQYRTGRDLCATFLSGTIVSNSLTELYNIFNYLRPSALAAQNIHSFDAWAAVFCQKKVDYEVNIVGQIKTKERFASYVNLPELSKFLAQITDYRTSVMCGIDAPKEVQHFESAPPTPNQEEMLGKLIKFVDSGCWSDLGIQRECPKNIDVALMLVATNVARQTALDPRTLDNCMTYGDEYGCKVRRCAENIMQLYRKYDEHKGTQFVFNDISTLDSKKWNMQQELRDLLVNEYGVPASEVEFINDATTDNKRMELFDKMNRGDVRILIGSTQKLGTGVNAQERAVAIHHLDIPWRPSDMEQRNGRAVRKGNQVKVWGNNEVQVFIYATERTLDAYKFSLLKSKQMFIQQLNAGTLGVRRIDDDIIGGDDNKAASYAEFLSILSGNTDLLDKARLDAKILALEHERASFYRERNNAVREMEAHEKEIAQHEEWIRYATYDIKHGKDMDDNQVPALDAKYRKLAGVKKADGDTPMKTAGREIAALVDKFNEKDYTIIGKCCNNSLAAIRLDGDGYSNGAVRFYIVGESGQYYIYPLNNGQPYRNSYELAAKYPLDTFENISKDVEKKKSRIAELKRLIPNLKEFSTKEWQGADELAELNAQLEAVKARITPVNNSKKAA